MTQQLKFQIYPGHLIPADDETGQFLDSLQPGSVVELEYPQERSYTEKQRGSLHVWCRMLAEELNNHGLDMRMVLKEDAEIPWSMYSVKEHIYKPVLNALTTKQSTEEQSTVEPSQVVDVIVRHLANNPTTSGIQVPWWPSKDREQGE